MHPEPTFPPDDPRAWLELAAQDLAVAQSRISGVGFGLLTYHAQQAAEKAVKAVLVAHSITFPYVHDIGVLLHLIGSSEVEVPVEVLEADILTDYATAGRYPGEIEIDENDYQLAVELADAVVAWAREIVGLD